MKLTVMVVMLQTSMFSRTMNRRPNVAPSLPVACLYTSARGNEPLLLITASRSLMPYRIVMA
jgi:hypothetical protein